MAVQRDAAAQVAAPRQLVDAEAEHAERSGEPRRERIGWGEERGRHQYGPITKPPSTRTYAPVVYAAASLAR